ncbi:MAG: hypothetical protein IJT23_01935 [Clostridia bacterium]|nr:hypothetical protein [Clostridia bacterium]
MKSKNSFMSFTSYQYGELYRIFGSYTASFVSSYARLYQTSASSSFYGSFNGSFSTDTEKTDTQKDGEIRVFGYGINLI